MNNSQKYLVLIEFDYHCEVLLNTLLIFQTLPFKTYLFTTVDIWEKISPNIPNEKLTVVIANKKRDVRKVIKQNIDIINKSEAVIFNTLASHFKLFLSIKFKSPVILRVHNANTYLNPIKSINPKFSFFYIWKDLSYLVLHGLFKFEPFYRSKFMNKKVTYFLFETESIQNYVLNNGYLRPEKILPPLPYVFTKSNKRIESSDNIVKIVIFGSIDKKRRNYNDILKAFKILAPKLQTKVVLSFLGKPNGFYGRRTIKALNKLQTKSLKINTFKKFVSFSDYDRISSEADFIIAPTILETRYKLYKELYGYTKLSGSVNDVIIYKKPALIPSFYPVPDPIKPHVQTYNNEENLVILLQKWIEQKEFKKYKIDSNIPEYTFANVKASNLKHLRTFFNY